MSMTLAPPKSDLVTEDEIVEIAQVAGVPVYSVTTIYEIVDHSLLPMVILRIDEKLASDLMQVLSLVLDELPTVLSNAPGSHRTTGWSSILAPLPFQNWAEFEVHLAKSGLLSHTTEQAEERSPATMDGHKTSKEDEAFISRESDNEKLSPSSREVRKNDF